MARLLIVHHTPSPGTQELLEAVVAGAQDDAIEGVEVVRRPALVASAVDALEADGYVLGTPVNMGYMSGALKHFFDQIYYPCMDATARRPFGFYVHGNTDTTGALRGIATITTGLSWEQVHAPVVVLGGPEQSDLDACHELGGTVAAHLI